MIPFKSLFGNGHSSVPPFPVAIPDATSVRRYIPQTVSPVDGFKYTIKAKD